MVKRLLVLTMLFMPATSSIAQVITSGAIREGTVNAAAASPGALPLVDSATQSQAPTARPAAARRRPSMVGYINDSTIGTQLRFRFDAGYQITSPDQAEFFYAKCGCYAGLQNDTALAAYFDPNAPGPGGAIMNDGNFQQLYVYGEYGFMGNRASLFVDLPVRWLKPQGFAIGSFGSTSGLSDLRLGAKVGLMTTDRGNATVQVQVTAPTGDSKKGLGTNHTSIEPSFLLGQQLGDRVGLEAQVGAVLPTGGSAGLPTSSTEKFAGQMIYYGIGPSFDLYSTDTVKFSPVVELIGWHIMGGFRTTCDTGEPCFTDSSARKADGDIVNLKIGARVVVKGQNSIFVGYGKALTSQTWYDDILRFEFRRSF